MARAGYAVLGLGLATSLAAATFLSFTKPEAALLVPGALLLAIGGAWTLRRPVVALCTLIGLSILLAGYGDSLASTLGEAVFGLYLLAYLGLWYGHAFLTGDPPVRTWIDVVLLVFTIGGFVVGVTFGIVFGASGGEVLGEAQAFAVLLLVWPIREACLHDDRAAPTIAAALVVLAVATTGWDAYHTWQAFNSAEYLWEVVDVRSAYGETTLTAALMLSLGLLLAARTTRLRLLLIAAVGIIFVGLILTKSRGFWGSSIVGVAVLVGVLPAADRRRMVRVGLTASLGVGVATLAIFGKYVQLVLAGIVNRFTTIGGAGRQDLSLINRFYESRAAWEQILANPIAGHGFGAPVFRMDLVTGFSSNVPFLHNGYVWMWFKLGLWGLALLMALLLSALVRARRAAQSRTLSAPARMVGAGCVGAVVALAIASNTSNPYTLVDQTLVMAVTLGLAHGVRDRDLRDAGEAPETAGEGAPPR